jgi:predicted amidophosphoribosyltransferase
MAMYKLCPECDGKVPLKETKCASCGYDEHCVCCYLYSSEPQKEESVSDGLAW